MIAGITEKSQLHIVELAILNKVMIIKIHWDGNYWKLLTLHTINPTCDQKNIWLNVETSIIKKNLRLNS